MDAYQLICDCRRQVRNTIRYGTSGFTAVHTSVEYGRTTSGMFPGQAHQWGHRQGFDRRARHLVLPKDRGPGSCCGRLTLYSNWMEQRGW